MQAQAERLRIEGLSEIEQARLRSQAATIEHHGQLEHLTAVRHHALNYPPWCFERAVS